MLLWLQSRDVGDLSSAAAESFWEQMFTCPQREAHVYVHEEGQGLSYVCLPFSSPREPLKPLFGEYI